MVKRLFGRCVIGGVALLAAGCAQEDGPLSPGSIVSDEVAQVALDCHMDVKGLSMSCEPQETVVVGGASAALFGNQGEFIELQAVNVKQVGQIFSADVMVKNLINQTLGTTDGMTKDPDAVRVFFSFEPISTDGSLSTETSAPPTRAGTVTHVTGAIDGTATFLEPNQVYYKYDQMVAPGRTSIARNWQWELSSEVKHFYFTVYVSAKLAREDDVRRGARVDVRSTSAGNATSCALTTTNDLYCWGYNSNGQTGTGAHSQTKALPGVQALFGGKDVLTVASGREHSCGITADSTAYCWGVNDHGQGGKGAAGNTPVPQAVAVNDKFISISAGGNHTCGVAADGTAYCWGHNGDGQIGNTSAEAKNYSPLSVSTAEKFFTVGLGYNFSCGVSAADSTAYCWGQNSYGQLGNGTLTSSATPVQVTGDHKFVRVAGGTYHACGLTPDGVAYCWGNNEDGSLGNGNNTSANTPQLVVGGHRFISLDATAGTREGHHSCGVTTAGKAYCWGSNSYGQLGNGTTTNSNVPVEVDAGGKIFISIATGARHTCATTNGGEAYCWGDSSNRQLGIEGGQLTPINRVENVNYFASVELFQSDEPSFAPAWTTFEAYAFGGRLAPVVGEG